LNLIERSIFKNENYQSEQFHYEVNLYARKAGFQLLSGFSIFDTNLHSNSFKLTFSPEIKLGFGVYKVFESDLNYKIITGDIKEPFHFSFRSNINSFY
jgi:hypothetical protein